MSGGIIQYPIIMSFCSFSVHHILTDPYRTLIGLHNYLFSTDMDYSHNCDACKKERKKKKNHEIPISAFFGAYRNDRGKVRKGEKQI